MQDKGYVQTLSTVLPTNLQKLSKQYLGIQAVHRVLQTSTTHYAMK